MRKIFKLGIIIVFLFMLIGCENGSLDVGEISISKTPNIGLNADTAGINDFGFNNFAYEGLVKARDEFNVKYAILESKEISEYERNIRNLANIKSIMFKNEEGAFLMGVIAGNMTKTNKIGFIGGVEAPIIEEIGTGFAYGIQVVNKDAAKDLINQKNIRYTMDFNDEEKGYMVAKELYNNGVDIIFHAAGKSGLGVFKAAKEEGKYAIGIDEDQGEKLKEYSGCILSSMIKKTDLAVYNSIEEFTKGTFKAGKDNILRLGLKEGAIDIASSTKNIVPSEVLDIVKYYKGLIINGELTIPKTSNEIMGS